MTPEDRPWDGSRRNGDYRLYVTDSRRDEDELLRVCDENLRRLVSSHDVVLLLGMSYICVC